MRCHRWHNIRNRLLVRSDLRTPTDLLQSFQQVPLPGPQISQLGLNLAFVSALNHCTVRFAGPARDSFHILRYLDGRVQITRSLRAGLEGQLWVVQRIEEYIPIYDLRRSIGRPGERYHHEPPNFHRQVGQRLAILSPHQFQLSPEHFRLAFAPLYLY